MQDLIELLSTTLQKPPKKAKKPAEANNLGNNIRAAAAIQKPAFLGATFVVKPSSVNVEQLPEPEFEIPLSAVDPGSDIFGIEEPEHPPFGKCRVSSYACFLFFRYVWRMFRLLLLETSSISRHSKYSDLYNTIVLVISILSACKL